MKKTGLLIAIIWLGFATLSYGQEPTTETKQDTTVIHDFGEALVQFIQQKADENGGYFKVKDKETGKTLDLKLIEIHEGKLCNLKSNIYFACADFEGTDQNTYDIDVFMKKLENGNFVENEKPMVHKVNGEPRYVWIQDEQGVWQPESVE